jgi:hypothetical protein
MSGSELMDRLIDAHNSRDVEALASCYAPGAGVHMDGWDQPVDVSMWAVAMDALRESFPDLIVRRGPATVGDGLVMAEIRMTGTNTGPLSLGTADRLVLQTDADRLPPTGRVMDILGVVCLEIAEQKVTAERHYWPAVEPLVQLGLVTLGAQPRLASTTSASATD